MGYATRASRTGDAVGHLPAVGLSLELASTLEECCSSQSEVPGDWAANRPAIAVLGTLGALKPPRLLVVSGAV